MFDITIDGKPVYRDYSSAVEGFTTETFTLADNPVAEVWYAVTKKKMLKPNPGQLVGFRVIRSGFVIGDTNPYSARKMAGFDELSVGQYPNWFVGEIHAISSDLRPNLPRTDFEESELKRKFVQKVRKWYDEQDVFCRVLSQKRDRLETYSTFENLIQEMKAKGAPLALSNQDQHDLIKIRDELYKDDSIAQQDKRGKAPKSAAHIEGRRDREVRNKRKAILTEVEQLLSHLLSPKSSEEKPAPKTKPPVLPPPPDETPKPEPSSPPAGVPVPTPTPLPSPNQFWVDEDEDDENLQFKQVSANVVLSLLEEVLREKLSDDSDLQAEILQTIQSRLSSVIIYG